MDAVTEPLGLAGAKVGQSVKSSGGAPRLAAVVEHVGSKTELILRLDQPAPGMAHLSALPMGDQVYLYVCLYLYGEGAAAMVAREEPVWRAWLERLFPAPVEQAGS